MPCCPRPADDLRPAGHFDLELGGGHPVRCPARRARAAGAGTRPRDAHDHSGDGGGLALFRRAPGQRSEVAGLRTSIVCEHIRYRIRSAPG